MTQQQLQQQENEIWIRGFCDEITELDWIYCQRRWWQWVELEGVWKASDEEVLSKQYYRWCDEHNLNGKEYYADMIRRLQAKLYHREWSELEMPNFVNLKNGMFCFASNELLCHQSSCYSREQLNIDFKPGPTPGWDEVRKQYPDAIAKFETILASVFRKDHSDEAMVWGVGPTGSGKGTISQILSLFGDQFTSYLKITNLGKEHMLRELVGKRINLDREAVIGYLNPEAVAYMKDIVTHEGPILINPKRKDPYNAYLDIWFFTFTNQLPTLPSGTDRKALFRRVVLLELDKIMPKNPQFKQQILAEAPAIVSNILIKPYQPFFAPGCDMDKYTEEIAAKWEFWSQPVRRICKKLFEYSEQPLDELRQLDVADWVDEALRREGIIERADNLKGKITEIFGSMKIHKRQKNKEQWYYNVIVIDKDLLEQIRQRTELEDAEKEKTFKQDTLEGY